MSVVGRREKKEAAIKAMEGGLNFLGISGVEDELQVTFKLIDYFGPIFGIPVGHGLNMVPFLRP